MPESSEPLATRSICDGRVGFASVGRMDVDIHIVTVPDGTKQDIVPRSDTEIRVDDALLITTQRDEPTALQRLTSWTRSERCA